MGANKFWKVGDEEAGKMSMAVPEAGQDIAYVNPPDGRKPIRDVLLRAEECYGAVT
jgi:hypothetical protein